MSEDQNLPEKKYWMRLNGQGVIYFNTPLNPGYVFWLKRTYRAKVLSEGGERVTLTRREPFSDKELEEIYLETEHRQQMVSKILPVIEHVFESGASFVYSAKLSREARGVSATERVDYDGG